MGGVTALGGWGYGMMLMGLQRYVGGVASLARDLEVDIIPEPYIFRKERNTWFCGCFATKTNYSRDERHLLLLENTPILIAMLYSCITGRGRQFTPLTMFGERQPADSPN